MNNMSVDQMNNMIEEANLKTCPFCGYPGVRVQSIRYPHSPQNPYLGHSIMCANENCIMHQTEKFYLTEIAAQIAWNERRSTT